MTRSNPKDALEEACKTIVELCGTCPAEHYGIGYDRCAEICRPDIELECWKDYFMGERWND